MRPSTAKPADHATRRSAYNRGKESSSSQSSILFNSFEDCDRSISLARAHMIKGVIDQLEHWEFKQLVVSPLLREKSGVV